MAVCIYTTNNKIKGWKKEGWKKYRVCDTIEEANAIVSYLNKRSENFKVVSVPGTKYKIVLK